MLLPKLMHAVKKTGGTDATDPIHAWYVLNYYIDRINLNNYNIIITLMQKVHIQNVQQLQMIAPGEPNSPEHVDSEE